MAGNPFDELILASDSNVQVVQDRYHAHRTNRNEQQTLKILDPGFKAFAIDEVLHKLQNSVEYPDFEDPRHCLVFWARPTVDVKKLAALVQEKLRAAFPNIWLMPEECMHMTAMEVTHSRTDEEIKSIISKSSEAFPEVADYTINHRARLVKPYLGFDSTAIALSYLPAADELSGDARDDSYTYHHLRRDLYDKCTEAGIEVQSRYVALSAHITMARFITQKDFLANEADELDNDKVKNFINVMEDINKWLQKEYWSSADKASKAGGEWVVGQGQGLTVREGQLWYGGGNSLYEGKGF